jgi:hypothetical protein
VVIPSGLVHWLAKLNTTFVFVNVDGMFVLAIVYCKIAGGLERKTNNFCAGNPDVIGVLVGVVVGFVILVSYEYNGYINYI